MFKVGARVRLIRRGIPSAAERVVSWSRDWPAEMGLEIGDTFTVTKISEGVLMVDDINAHLDPWYFEKEGFKPDEVILVRSGPDMKWRPRHFVRMEGDRALCIRDGRSIKTTGNDKDVVKWPYFKRLED
jgi:hypothetical protein